MNRIDAHHHVWQLDRFEYPFIEPGSVLHRSYGLAELGTATAMRNVDRTVLVQTIASVDESRWFLDLARQNPMVAGVVGWVDLTDAAVGTTLDSLVQNSSLVGIRHNVHDEPDDLWLLRSDVQRGLAEVCRRSLAYDLLIRPQHLTAALRTAEAHPELRLVVDHIAKPNIAGGGWDDWAPGIAALARQPQVHCKLSGMITEADHRRWRATDLAPYIDHVLTAFGSERVMFGSDWPVCLLAGTYEQVFDAVADNLAKLSATEREAVFGGNAARFYRLRP